MPALTQLSRRNWQHFFARVSAALAVHPASVDTSGLDADLPGERIHLLSASFDPESGELALLLEGEQRLVRHPRQVHVHLDEDLLHSIELVDADGQRDFLVLHRPLPLLLRK
jgi:hypothetical protein